MVLNVEARHDMRNQAVAVTGRSLSELLHLWNLHSSRNCRMRHFVTPCSRTAIAWEERSCPYATLPFEPYLRHDTSRTSRLDHMWHKGGHHCWCSEDLLLQVGVAIATVIRVQAHINGRRKCSLPRSSTSRSEARIFCCSMLGAFGSNRPSF